MGNATTWTSPRNVFLTRDERWVALSASSHSIAERLIRVALAFCGDGATNIGHLSRDPEHELVYRRAITAAIEDELAADPTVVFFGEDVAAAGGV